MCFSYLSEGVFVRSISCLVLMWMGIFSGSVFADSTGDWAVILVSVSKSNQAEGLIKDFNSDGYFYAEKQKVLVKGKVWWRVIVPGFSTRAKATEFLKDSRVIEYTKSGWVSKTPKSATVNDSGMVPKKGLNKEKEYKKLFTKYNSGGHVYHNLPSVSFSGSISPRGCLMVKTIDKPVNNTEGSGWGGSKERGYHKYNIIDCDS